MREKEEEVASNIQRIVVKRKVITKAEFLPLG